MKKQEFVNRTPIFLTNKMLIERGESMSQTESNHPPASLNLEEVLWKDFLKTIKEEKENKDEPLLESF